jgi:hypothetical protein
MRDRLPEVDKLETTLPSATMPSLRIASRMTANASWPTSNAVEPQPLRFEKKLEVSPLNGEK